MTEQELQQYLKAHYPKENEGCEWKEFKNLKNDFNGKEKEVSVKVYARQANISKESFMTSEKSQQHQENVIKEPSVTPASSMVEPTRAQPLFGTRKGEPLRNCS